MQVGSTDTGLDCDCTCDVKQYSFVLMHTAANAWMLGVPGELCKRLAHEQTESGKQGAESRLPVSVYTLVSDDFMLCSGRVIFGYLLLLFFFLSSNAEFLG